MRHCWFGGQMLMRCVLAMTVLAWSSGSVGAAENAQASEPAALTAAVETALTAKCLACHRPGNAKGGLDLSTREAMLRGGESGAALVVEKPDESAIFHRSIAADGKRPEMPETGEPLTAAESESLRLWIAAGAPWTEGVILKEKSKADGSFWSLQPLRKIEPPTAGNQPAAWSQNPVDRFVLAKLTENGLAPNPPADPREFIRRATFDLIGLPPTPEEVEAFAAACQNGVSDEAVQKLIDDLLSRPQYGERWGRHWLDVIRFGESRGYERNEIITNLWPFRDYVIQSFNDDKPIDQLILEHLAGDVIGKDQPNIEIGSAFLVAGPYDDVGNQDAAAAAQIRADQMDEMIRATSEAFLGLTLGCARCHDHKFDPLLAKDYYAFYATFAGTVHGPREVASSAERAERQAKLAPLQEQLAKRVAERDAFAAELKERMKQLEEAQVQRWVRSRISRYATEETFEPRKVKFVRMIVEGTDTGPANQPQFRIDEFEIWTQETTPRNVALASAGAKATGESRAAKDFAEAYVVDHVIDGKFGERWHAAGNQLLIELAQVESIDRVVFSSDRNKALGEDHALTLFVGDYQIETSIDGKEWQAAASSEDRLPPSEARKQARLAKIVLSEEDAAKRKMLDQAVGEIEGAIRSIPAHPVWWVGTHRPISGPQHLFVGGSPQKKGEEVSPGSLDVLASLPSAYQLDASHEEGARRVALAKWIASADNPLSPRVLANRVWQHHFGSGIVDTPSDFGYLGSRPSHPELLDWLASQLLENGWKLKPLHRLLMTSQAYRQSSHYREDAAKVDADSRLLWRYPPRRLEAEEIRDSMLQVAAKLDLKMGGPGFRLYEYQQDNVATYVPLDVHGPETYRRAIYHHNARSARVDLLTDFDCPDPAFAEPKRATTTTPLQALTLMNHRFPLDMTEFLAKRLEAEAIDTPSRVKRVFALAYSREPSAGELDAASKIVESHGLRALCRAILNSNEFVSVP